MKNLAVDVVFALFNEISREVGLSYRMPPLNALRAFERAARHVNFTKAADELFVTPGAVSRQIKLLEDVLGQQLFDRARGELKISPASQKYAAALSEAFEQIEKATKRFVDDHRDQPLRINCAMTFTLRWLVPRLPQYHRLYPESQIQLTTALRPRLLHLIENGDIDVAVRLLEPGERSDFIVHRLASGDLVPVCSPAFLERLGGSLTLDMLARQTLLRSTARPSDWLDWLKAAGVTNVDAEKGLFFESASLAYQAAVEGMGIAIGKMALVSDDLASGRLIAPINIIHDNGSAYYFTYAKRLENDSRLIELREWVLGQATEYASQLARMRLQPAVAMRAAS